MNARWPLAALMLTLSGCAAHRPPVVAEVAPPVEVAVGPALPPGATPGMLVPVPLADGSFPTPNQGLTDAAAIWHLRAGLNVAALSCPGEQGAAIRASYNGWLKRDKASLARVAKAYAATYAIKAGAGSYDDAMTRLYNFFSQTPARPGLCAAAASVLTDMTSAAGASPAATTTRLANLDRPFTDFYQAYDAWRAGGRTAAVMPVTPTTTVIAALAIAPARPVAPPRPIHRGTLTLDLSTLPADTAVVASR